MSYEPPPWFSKLKHMITEQDCEYLIVVCPRQEKTVYFSSSSDIWAQGMIGFYDRYLADRQEKDWGISDNSDE